MPVSPAESPTPHSERDGLLSPARAAALFALLGAGWIALADLLAKAVSHGEQQRDWLHLLLSFGFVLASALLLFSLLRSVTTSSRRAERVLRSTLQSIADPVLLLDRSGQVVDTNPAALEMFGVADKRELLRPIADYAEAFTLRLADGSKVPAEHFASVAALRGQTTRRYEALLQRADGSDLFVSVSSAPVRERPDAPVEGAVTVLHDIDALKRLEKLRDQFLSVAAHELKSPLATVKGYAQLLQRPAAPSPAPYRHGLSVIERQADRMDRLVRELLDLSRLRVGRLQLNRSRLDLAQVLAEAAERAQVLTARHRVTFEAQGGPALVDADRERLDQVLSNLFDNALKFSPDGGEIRVRVRAAGDEVVASVEDHGVGISPERCEHLFEQFYQVDPGSPTNPTGLGLGLFLSKQIVAQHGGRIWVESALGQGSTFFVALPAARPLEQGLAPASDPAAPADLPS